MINPGEIPQIPGDMDALAAYAEAVKTAGFEFAGTGQAVDSTWQGLAAVYQAPEAAQLFAATGPVRTVSASVGEDIEAVGRALTTYAIEVKEIKARLAALKVQAEQFVESIHGDKDWRDDEDKVDRHNGLISAVNTQVAAFFEAQRRCANTINALYGGRQYRADNADGKTEDGEYGYTGDLLNAAAAKKGLLPWGSTAKHDRGVVGDVGAFFVGVGEGFMNLVRDLGALIGRDPATGDWSWGTAGAAWKGLGEFAYAVAITTSVSTVVPELVADDPDGQRDKARDLVLNAAKTMIAYDTWGEDKSRAAGQTTFNIVSSVATTKGAGAGLRGAGVAVEGIRGSTTAARVGAGLVRAGVWLDNLPTAGQVAVNVAHKLHIHIPHLGPVPAIAGDVPIHSRGIDLDPPPHTRGGDPMHMNSGPGGAPGAHTPGGHTPGGDLPGDRAPGGHSPGDHTPDGIASGDGTPGGGMPGDRTPGDAPPSDRVPGDAAPGDGTPAGNAPGGTTPGSGHALSPAERQQFLDTANRLGPDAEAQARSVLARQDIPEGLANQAVRDFVDLHNSGRVAGAPARQADIFRAILDELSGGLDHVSGAAAELRAANEILARSDLAPGSRIGLSVVQGERINLGNGTFVDTGDVPQADLIYQTADGKVHMEEVKATANTAASKLGGDSNQLQRMLNWRAAAPGREIAIRIGTDDGWTGLFRLGGDPPTPAIHQFAYENVPVTMGGRTLTRNQLDTLHQAILAATRDPAHPMAGMKPGDWFARYVPNLAAAREFLRPYGVDFL